MFILTLTILICVLYIIVIGIAFAGLLKRNKFEKSSTEIQKISVIIPFKNEEKNLHYIADDLTKQVLSLQFFEVIFVDDNSTDKSLKILEKFTGRNSNFRIEKNSGFGKKSAIITGIQKSTGDVIVTTDADCRLNRNWLLTIYNFFCHNDAEMLIMPVVYQETKKLFTFENFQALEFLSLSATTAGFAKLKLPIMCNGANLAYTKQAFFRFKDALNMKLESGDDTFLMFKIKKYDKNKIAYLQDENLIVRTKASKTLHQFFNQRIRWSSKTKYYDDLFVKIVGIAVLSVNFWILFLLFGLNFRLFIVLFISKSLLNFILLFKFSKFTKQGKLLWFFLPMEFIYPFYIVMTTVCSFFCKYKWK